ncbi:MAG: arylesterase [Pseudomonadota bacterium]|nr:arylesterase [Pseudomonadota bacterium]
MALQIMLLAGCDKAPASAVTNDSATAAATAAPDVARPAGPERLILAFGDSLYAGYGLSRGQSLPDAIQARLRKNGVNATIVNAGVSGDTSAAGLQRLGFALDNLTRKPDLVMIGLGGNDVLRQIGPAETRANMTAMMAELAKRDIPVVLTGMKAPPNLGPDYAKAFDAIWPDLAKRYDAALYPFILDGVIDRPTLLQPDHIHPTAAGVRVVADRLLPVVQRELADTAINR